MSGPPPGEGAAGGGRDPWSGPVFVAGSIAGAWTMYLVVAALRLALFASPAGLVLFPRHMATAAVGAALTVLIHLVLRRFKSASLPVRIGAAMLACAPPAVVLAVINYDIVFVVAADRIWSARDLAGYSLQGVLAVTLAENYFLLLAWSLLYTAVSGAALYRQAREAALAAEAQTRAAQLQALRYQLDPHLIFNALNTVSALVLRKRTDEAEVAVSALSAFLRSTLDTEAVEDVTLEEELRHQHLYLAVEQARFGERLAVSVSLAEEARLALVPSLILQPLVENAVRHGVSRTARRVRLSIGAHVEGASLQLRVSDDAEAAGPSGAGGVGLRNVRDRLAARFGPAAACTYGPRPGGGFEVSLRLPFRRAG